MQIKRIDHFVITTSDIKACIHFYVDILEMKLKYQKGRYALYFGNQKINIHTKKGEFLPAAQNPTYGSLDLCFIVKGPIENVYREIQEKGYPIFQGPVCRHGALGNMQSIYLYDPDGNLIELSGYEGDKNEVESH